MTPRNFMRFQLYNLRKALKILDGGTEEAALWGT